MPALDLEVRTQLNLALAEAAANEALRIFSRTGDEIATGFGGRISRALGGFSTSAAQTELRALQSEYAKLAAVEKAAGDLAVRRASEVEVALRRKVAVQASDTATTLEAARAERALVDARRANEQALRRHESAMINTAAAQERLGSSAVAAGTAAETASRAFNVLGVGAVAATGVAMVESTKSAADFQQGLERLSAVTGDTADNVKVVHDGILQLAGQVGYTMPELTKAMLGVEKAGYRGADGIKVLTAAAQFASEENADLGETINGVTTSMHDFHIPVEKATEVTSKLNAAVGLSKVSAQEFGGSLHSIEPIASALGDSLNDVYAAVATLTQSGMSADQATQNLAHSFTSLSKPTQTMRDEMAGLGLDWRDISQHLGDRGIIQTSEMLHDAVTKKLGPSGQVMLDTWFKSQSAADSANQMMAAMPPQVQAVAQAIDNGTLSYAEFRKTRGGLSVEQANEINQWKAVEDKLKGFNNTLKSGQGDAQGEIAALANLVGGQDNLRTILQLTGKNQRKANDNLKQLTNTTADADGKTRGFTGSQETYNAKMKDAKAAFEATRIEVGEAFLPVMTHMLDVTKDVGQVLATHPGILHGVEIGVGALGGAWLTFQSINVVDKMLNPISRALTGMATAEAAAADGAGLMSKALGALGPIAAGAAVGATTAGPVEHFMDNNSFLNNARNDIRGLFGAKPIPQGTHADSVWSTHENFAGGGEMRAPGPAGRDSALFWGADGEHILTHQDVQAMGGHSGVYAFRNALHRDMGGGIGPDVQAAMGMVGTGYSQGSRTDCSGMVARVINAAMGIGGGGLMSTKNAESWLAQRGFQPGVGGPGAITVGWYDHGPNPNDGHMAMTLSNGMPAESGGSHGNFLIGAGAAGATASEFDHHMFLPAAALYGEGPGGSGMGAMGGGGGGGFGGVGGFGGGGIPAGATAGTGPMGQAGYYMPDQTRVASAQERLRHLDQEIANAEERKSEMKSTAKQSERDRLDEEIRHLNEERTNAQAQLEEAQRGTFHESRGGGRSARETFYGGKDSAFGVPLPDNFGLGKGLPGMAEWLVDWIGSMAMASAAPMFAGMGGAGGSESSALPMLAGFGGDMPSPTAADSGATPTALGGAGGAPAASTTAAVSPAVGASTPSNTPARRQMPTPGPSSGAGWFGAGAYGDPSAPGVDYKSWYPMATDPYAGSNPFGIDIPNRYSAANPNNVGPNSAGRSAWMNAPGATIDHNAPLPQFGPGGSSMQDMLNAARQHGWSDKPIYGGLPGVPIADPAIHRSTGGPSGTDTIPAWLSPGEFTQQKSAVDRYGLPFMQAINEGRVDPSSVRYFGIGGLADDPEPAAQAAAITPPKPPTPTAPVGAPPGIAQALGVPQQGDPNAPQGGGETVQSGTKSMPFNQGQSSPGLGISGGAGGAAAGMFPGGGLAEALAGRTVAFGGQLAGIGVEAAIQTLLPNDSPLANFSGTLPGKILGAVAGARPAGKNTAGQQTPQLTKDQVDAKDAKNMGGRGDGMYVEQHNYGVNNGDDVAAALTRAQLSSSSAGRTR